MAPMEYLRAWETLIHEKNLKSKISCQNEVCSKRKKKDGEKNPALDTGF